MSDEPDDKTQDVFDLLARELPVLDVDERRAERIRWRAQGEMTRHRLRNRGVGGVVRRAWRKAEPFVVGTLVASHLVWVVQAALLR